MPSNDQPAVWYEVSSLRESIRRLLTEREERVSRVY